MIKYLGSKRRLVPVLGEILSAVDARRALDLFTGTTRVAQEFKRRGAHVTAVDNARYAKVFGDCYIAADATSVDKDELVRSIDRLNGLPGRAGYVTETFCIQSRFFEPANGARIDAIREQINREFGDSPLYPIVLTSLIEAADRVDSTTGVQMAYLKQWAPRATNQLALRVPDLLVGSGHAVQDDALAAVEHLGPFDLAYLDPPYNQHRYFTNYHVWETLVAWDHPAHYGRACKRVDARDASTSSVFNRKAQMPAALRHCIERVDAEVIVVSYNDESWVSLDELREMCCRRGTVEVLGFDSRRYVGAQIGIYNPAGARVGHVSHLHNTEWVLVAGRRSLVTKAIAPFRSARVTTSRGVRRRR